MKNPSTTLSLLITIACFCMLSENIKAQEPTYETENLISTHTEEIDVYSFVYSASSRTYEVTCNSTRPYSEEEGQLSVFMSFDDSDEFIYLPESEEDVRSIRKGANEMTYEIDPMGMIKVVIQNPNGGTPWSTMDVDKIQVKQYFLTSNVAPLNDWGMNLEDEETLSALNSLTQQYVQEQLTNR